MTEHTIHHRLSAEQKARKAEYQRKLRSRKGYYKDRYQKERQNFSISDDHRQHCLSCDKVIPRHAWRTQCKDCDPVNRQN